MSLTGKSPSETYKDIAYVDNSNNGVTTSLKQVKTGNGGSTALQVSDRALQVKSATNNTTALDVQNASGTSKLLVDTTNNYVKANGVHVNTMYKQFMAFDLSPTAGIHYPMASAEAGIPHASGDASYTPLGVFGNSADPATTFDVSGHATYPNQASLTYWYIMDNMYIDSIRVIATAAGNVDINFHVMSYDLDTSTNHGDLSNGTLLAHIGSSLAATGSTMKTDTLTIDSASVTAGKIVLAFIENETDTSDITAQLNIKYHITG
tara:strand:- start:221 stop:1012 length:792 start_codon:yes stop_codon:yes gene_type:complete